MALKRLDNGEIYFGEAKWTAWDTIECIVQDEDTDEILNFHATPYDPEDYGRELFEMMSTKYSDMVEACSDEDRYSSLHGEAVLRRGSELRNSDWIANGDVLLANQVEWLQYRQDLRDITLQEGYPLTIVWPTRPDITYSTPVDERISAKARSN